jgi:hypothetical protein
MSAMRFLDSHALRATGGMPRLSYATATATAAQPYNWKRDTNEILNATEVAKEQSVKHRIVAEQAEQLARSEAILCARTRTPGLTSSAVQVQVRAATLKEEATSESAKELQLQVQKTLNLQVRRDWFPVPPIDPPLSALFGRPSWKIV